MVFQQFNLFPNMTVLDNVTCAARCAKRGTEAEITQRAKDLLERVGLPTSRASTRSGSPAASSSASPSPGPSAWSPT